MNYQSRNIYSLNITKKIGHSLRRTLPNVKLEKFGNIFRETGHFGADMLHFASHILPNCKNM